MPLSVENRLVRLIARLALPGLLAVCAGGCSYVTVAPDGSRTLTGFMRLTLPAQTTAANRVRIETVGAAFVHTPLETQFAFGFNDATLTAIEPDSCAAFENEGDYSTRKAPVAAQTLNYLGATHESP